MDGTAVPGAAAAASGPAEATPGEPSAAATGPAALATDEAVGDSRPNDKQNWHGDSCAVRVGGSTP